MNALAKLRVRLFLGDGGDPRRELVQIVEPEAVVDGGIDRRRETGIGGQVDLELSDAGAFLFRELLLRQAALEKTTDLVQRGGDRRVAALRSDRDADDERSGDVGRVEARVNPVGQAR